MNRNDLFGSCDTCDFQALLDAFEAACAVAGGRNEVKSEGLAKRGATASRGGSQKRGRAG